jgi:small conductance mechanosensitive channel
LEASTASEQVILGVQESWSALLRLGPAALALNVALSLLVVGAAFGVGLLVRRLLKRGARAVPGPSDAEKTIRTRRVTQVTWAVFETGLVLAAFFALAGIWGFDLLGWLTAGLGQRVVESVIRIAILAVVTFAAAELATLLVNRLLARIAQRKAGGARREAQLNTIGPLIHGVARGVIIIIGAMMILAEIGLEIGPLLAGAGVIGLAIGFGAQTLVKDFLTGIFLISEDIVAVGDVVEIAGSSGVVEQMTIRTIRLRALDGTLHVLPYGEAQIIHNMTKIFSYHVIELGVSYESDIDKAFEVMAEVVEDMRADPDLGPKILEPLEVMDVSALADSGVVLRGRIKTPPGDQWGIGRAFNRRIKTAWEAAGIEIPYPHMHLVVPQPLPQPPAPEPEA